MTALQAASPAVPRWVCLLPGETLGELCSLGGWKSFQAESNLTTYPQLPDNLSTAAEAQPLRLSILCPLVIALNTLCQLWMTATVCSGAAVLPNSRPVSVLLLHRACWRVIILLSQTRKLGSDKFQLSAKHHMRVNCETLFDVLLLHTVLAEDPSWVPSAHIRRFTTIWNSSCKGSNSSDLLGHYSHIHTIKNKNKCRLFPAGWWNTFYLYIW